MNTQPASGGLTTIVACCSLLLGSLGLTQSARAAAQRTFYLSPTGNDGVPGSEAKPFKTLDRARDAVRAVNQRMAGDIVVVLRGGTYAVARTLVLDHRDSGTNGHSVVYRSHPGERPILSGGRRITGWQPDANGRWKAPCPIDSFRQLYVNGVRATRATGHNIVVGG